MPAGNELDGEVLTAALEAVDAGLELSRASLLERFPGRQVAVDEVLRRVGNYENLMLAERRLAKVPPREGVLARGTKLGEFTVLELIGKGGFGESESV